MGPKRAKLAEDAEKDAEMDEEVSDESTDSEDEKMDEDEATNDDQPEGMEQLDFDFEALPPDAKDINQIGNLLTQIFLRTDIDFDGLSQAIVDQAPVGCVILPTEDCVDEDNDDTVYGVSSVVPLSAEKNFGVGELLTQRAKKYADKNVAQTLAKLFGKNSTTKLGLLINERMLHFPAQISGKALEALKNDIQSNASLNEIETFIVILKMRFSEEGVKADGPSNSKVKPKGKAAKKRARASKLEATEALFDNEEEGLLFEAMDSEFSYFQYPVHFDVESKSKFHVIRRNGVVYQPYRRVCLLSQAQLFGFCNRAAAAFA
ncbi:hypothetical protein M3Y97_00056100 [Aphelenchoides bicaudatus]|nr:hypothetical protein M3Y97_00056100 [Aphelenchoides bicaudatus]